MSQNDVVSFDILPDNIILEIFIYLNVKELLQSQRVCKRWRNLLSDKWLWKTVAISPLAINKVQLAKIVRKYFSEVTTSLEICGASRGRDLKNPVAVSNNVFSLIKEKSPNLQILKIEEDNLKEANVSLLPSSTQQLSLTNCEIPLNSLENIKNKFVNLKSLLFRRCPIICDAHLAAFGKLECLRRLECYGCYRLDQAAVCEIVNNFPNLEVLVLVGCPHLGDRSCVTIAQGLPKLRVVEIEEWVDLTYDGIMTLRKHLKNLKFLSIKCRSVNAGSIVIDGSRLDLSDSG